MASILTLSEEFRQDRGRELVRLIREDVKSRAEWDYQRVMARNLYHGNGVRLDVHWEGASDLHFGITYEKVEGALPRFHNAFWNIEPKARVRRVADEYDKEENDIQTEFINWVMDVDIDDFFDTSLSYFRNMLLDGLGAVKVYWAQQWRYTCQVYEVKALIAAGEQTIGGFTANSPRPKPMVQIFDEVFGQGAWTLVGPTPDNDFGVWQLEIIEDRRRIQDVVVQAEESDWVDQLRLKVWRPILTLDRGAVDIIEAEDLIVPYRTKDVQTADRVTHRYWIPIERIVANRHKSREEWNLSDDDIDRLTAIAHSNVSGWDDDAEQQHVREHKDQIAGERPPQDSDKAKRRVRFYEVYATEDLDGDGQTEEVIYQISHDLEKIVHATYLDARFPHGERPIVTVHYNKPSDRFYSYGMGWLLAPINIQINTTINQINDNQELINNPIFFFRPTAMMVDAEILRRIPPGTGIPTNDPGGVVFPQWTQTPLANIGVFDSMMMMADRISGISPFMSGSSQQRNAPRTARGTLALLSEGNIRVDIIIGQARKAWRRILSQLTSLYHENMPDEKYFWATGRDRKQKRLSIMRKHLRGKFEYILDGNAANSNSEVQRSVSEIRYATAATNPLYPQDPAAFQALLRDFIMHHKEGSVDVEALIPKLPGQGALTHPPMSQRDETTAMRFGNIVDVLQSDNHAEHVADLQRTIQAEEFASWPQFVQAIITAHLRQHIMLLNQQAAMQLPQSAGGGEQSIPRGLADLEGGVQ